MKVHIFGLSTALVKVHQTHHVIFQTKDSFFFKVWIFSQCHERLDWNGMLYFVLTKSQKKNQISEFIIQVLAHIN